MIEDGWYKVTDTGKPRIPAAISEIKNGRHVAGGMRVDFNMRFGFIYERVYVFTKEELILFSHSVYDQWEDRPIEETVEKLTSGQV